MDQPGLKWPVRLRKLQEKAADIVEEITDKLYEGFIRTIFLEGKFFEMLVLQIKQYQDDHREDKLPQILDVQMLKELKRQ